MKLNPFNKKSSAYYDKVKAEHDQLRRQLASVNKELIDAEQQHAQERDHQTRLRDAAGKMSMNTPPAAKAHWPVLCAAHEKVDRLKSQASSLESQIRPLLRVLDAPDAFAQAKKKLDDLVAQNKAHSAEVETTDRQIAKLNKRIADLEIRISTETKSASQTLIDGDGEFVVPESLTKLEMELRIVRSSLADLQSTRDMASAKLGDLPVAMREAERTFIHCRAVVVEIDLYEQLMPVMNAVARASAARRETSYRHDETRFEIEIPHELVEIAQAALADEVPAT
jgi:septal ring factor EnvC (AmiA/AmiB activator)